MWNGIAWAAVALLAASLLSAAEANAQPAGATAAQRPEYQWLRYEEDWSVLRGKPPVDFWDPIKFIPVGNDDIRLSLGGHSRTRVEGWSNWAFGAPRDPDDMFVLWRLFAHADLHLGPYVRTFVEIKSALEEGRALPGSSRPVDKDQFDLEKGFVDLKMPIAGHGSLTLRTGRQGLLFKKRLLHTDRWTNTSRRWDGVSAIAQYEEWRVHSFYTLFAPTLTTQFNETDWDNRLAGAYFMRTGKGLLTNLDLYYLWIDREDQEFNRTSGREKRHTFGTNLKGVLPRGSISYDFEAAYQTGEVGDGDVSAWMGTLYLSAPIPKAPWSARGTLGLDYASGDHDSEGDVETFNPLFPVGHEYFGIIDTIGRYNILSPTAALDFTPLPLLKLQATWYSFFRADTSDGVYTPGGQLVRRGIQGGARTIGHELDFTAQYPVGRHIELGGGWGHFFTDKFIEQSGPSDDIDFVYLQFTYTI